MIYIDYLEFNDLQIEITCDDSNVLGIKDFTIKSEIAKNYLTDEVKKQLLEYFKGDRKEFDLPLLIGDSFYDNVYKALLENVGYGDRLSYAELGKLIKSKAYRAIGSAMSNNKYLIVVPCHRVIRSNGDIGQYKYGQEMKRYLLDLEKSN